MSVPVVLRYRNGEAARVLAPPQIERSREAVLITGPDGQPAEVPFSRLKAIFYLRDESVALDQDEIDESTAATLLVEFQDGEKIRGISNEYSPDRNGFFLYPADRSKNDKIFVVNSAIVSIDVEKM